MNLKLDRPKFWELYHKKFDSLGSTTQITVDSLNAILDLFESETRLKFISWFAYILATAYAETGINGNHFLPVKEGRERVGAKGRANQDRYWFTGFYGRGLIQTTWESGYRALGKLLGLGEMFVQSPDLLLQIKWSYASIVAGMINGIYRGDKQGRHTLARHLLSDDCDLDDYYESREIVNGDKAKNGMMIARYANNFEEILLAARILDDAPAPLLSHENDPQPQAVEPDSPVETPESSHENLSKTAPVTSTGADTTISVEDWKPWVFGKLKLLWTSFTGVNLTQAGGGIITAFKSGEHWYIPVIISVAVIILTFIACALLSTALLAIWHFNRKEIVGFINASAKSHLDPNSPNLGLIFKTER